MFSLRFFPGQMIDFTTDTISTDYESIDSYQSTSINRNSIGAIKRVSLISSNFTSSISPSSTKVHIGLTAMNILVIMIFILILTVVLLLIVRRYFNAKKWNSSNNDNLNTHSIKYISDKQFNKIHIDMNAEDALNCEKEYIDPCQRHSNEFESNDNPNKDENEQNKMKTNIFDRVKRQLSRPTLLAAAATTGRYRNLNETM